jgi:hypothetical protein
LLHTCKLVSKNPLTERCFTGHAQKKNTNRRKEVEIINEKGKLGKVYDNQMGFKGKH